MPRETSITDVKFVAIDAYLPVLEHGQRDRLTYRIHKYFLAVLKLVKSEKH